MATIDNELTQILPSFDDGADSDPGNRQSIESLLERALASPIDHPALSDSIFPGDRVAILVQNGLPAALETLRSLVSVLDKANIETENVLVVVPQSMAKTFELTELRAADPDTKTPVVWRMKSDQSETPLQFEVHAADNEDCASYLAANEEGRPVYVNRSLCDSDVVLPLSCISPTRKQSDCLYPEFSTDETRDRYRKKEDSPKQRTAEAELANDSLGLFFSIEMICRPGEIVDDIVCGSRLQARQIASDRLDELWHMEAPGDCDVAFTTIESAGEKATWNNVVRAVRTAAMMVDDGPIVVWSDLSERPTSKIKKACHAQFEGSVPDSLPNKLQHFASILCERPVYLKSRLSQNVVEELGLGHIESIESAQRILGSFTNPFLIRDGHLRNPPVEQEVGD